MREGSEGAKIINLSEVRWGRQKEKVLKKLEELNEARDRVNEIEHELLEEMQEMDRKIFIDMRKEVMRLQGKQSGNISPEEAQEMYAEIDRLEEAIYTKEKEKI